MFSLLITLAVGCMYMLKLHERVHTQLINNKYYYYLFTIIHTLIKQCKVWLRNYIIDNYVNESFKLVRHPGYLHISYIEDGIEKYLYIPLRSENALLAMQCEVNIIYDKVHGEELKQDTDIPIMVTPKDLGAKHVQVYNTFTCEERIYKNYENIEYFE